MLFFVLFLLKKLLFLYDILLRKGFVTKLVAVRSPNDVHNLPDELLANQHLSLSK